MLKPVARITIYQSATPAETAKIEIDRQNDLKPLALQFYSYHACNIDSSWENLTQKAQVILPRRLKYIGGVVYSFEDYYKLSPKVFTANIEKQIFGLGEDDTMDPLIQGTSRRRPVSLIPTNGTASSIINYSPMVNNGEKFDDNVIRTNPLIQRGDMIVIQLGYLIKDKSSNTIFNTIASYPDAQKGGNVGLGSYFSKKLPNTYQKETPTIDQDGNAIFNVNNRWKPYNRNFQFKGYISKTSINNDGNIVLDCEDYMYLWKRALIPDFVYTSVPSDNVPEIAKFQKDSGKKVGWTFHSIFADMIVGARNPPNVFTKAGIQNGDYLPKAVIQPTDENGQYFLDDQTGTVDTMNSSMRLSDKMDISLGGGKLTCQNASIGQVFQKIKDDMQIPIFFRPNTDVLSYTPYVYNDTTVTSFKIKDNQNVDNEPSIGQEEFMFITGQWSETSDAYFNDTINRFRNGNSNGSSPNQAGFTLKNRQNIICSNLEFRRADDAPVGVYVKSNYRVGELDDSLSQVKTTDGRKKKKLVDEAVFVGQPGGYTFTAFYLSTTDTDKIVVRNGKIDSAVLVEEMKKFGWNMLSRYNYTGLAGSFTTYGYPYIQFSDIVSIIDMSFPERSGRYYVKKVIYRADLENGLTQEIFIDYKIPEKS